MIPRAAQKAVLRRELRARRQALAPAQRLQAACAAARRLLQLPEARRARRMAVYLSCGTELPTGPLIAALHGKGRALFAPLLDHGGRLRFVPLTRGAKLRRDPLGFMRPVSARTRLAPRRLDVLVLPLLGFDTQGRRLGQGGGHYDRALAFARIGQRPRRIGYAYAVQEAGELPADPWDVRLDAVVTERKVHRFR